MSIYSGLKCRPLLWLLLGFKFFLVISETPPFIKTHSALICRFLNQLIDVLQGLGICRNTSFILFFFFFYAVLFPLCLLSVSLLCVCVLFWVVFGFFCWLYNWHLCCWACMLINTYLIELNWIIVISQIQYIRLISYIGTWGKFPLN